LPPNKPTVKQSAAVFRPRSTRLLDQVREVMRYHHYSPRSEKAYLRWIRDFILFHNKRHPGEMGREEIEAYLSHLAMERHVARSTQNQAFNALLLLYRRVLACHLPAISRPCAPSGRRSCPWY